MIWKPIESKFKKPKPRPGDFYFGKGICAICLRDNARRERYMDKVYNENDKVVASGTQHVHLDCFNGLRDLLREAKLDKARELRQRKRAKIL